jgi:hypothetical protein
MSATPRADGYAYVVADGRGFWFQRTRSDAASLAVPAMRTSRLSFGRGLRNIPRWELPILYASRLLITSCICMVRSTRNSSVLWPTQLPRCPGGLPESSTRSVWIMRHVECALPGFFLGDSH